MIRRWRVGLVTLLGAAVIAGCTRDSATPASAPATTSSVRPTTPSAPTTSALTSAATTSVTVAPSGVSSDGLQAVVDRAVSNIPALASVVALDLTTGARAEHLGSRVVLSASLYKLFVARELFRRIGNGSLRREEPSGDGAHSVEECLRLMIVVSDDHCGVAGLVMVGRGALNAALHRDGFAGTALDSPQRTTARDVAELISRERDRTSELYGLMRQQRVSDRMPAFLPPGTPIAHKTGDRTGWAHDAGVITTPRGDVLVVVLTGPWPSPCCHEERIGDLERRAFGVIGAIARAIYDWAAATG